MKYEIKNNKGSWNFESHFANAPQDGLPQDAWIGFMSELNNKKTYSAHNYLKPLDLKDQKKLLQVGSCLQCHGKDTQFTKRMVNGEYQKMLKNKTKKCITPL